MKNLSLFKRYVAALVEIFTSFDHNAAYELACDSTLDAHKKAGITANSFYGDKIAVWSDKSRCGVKSRVQLVNTLYRLARDPRAAQVSIN